eukprot:4759940-Pleurochrysis_carterae.AAC.1
MMLRLGTATNFLLRNSRGLEMIDQTLRRDELHANMLGEPTSFASSCGDCLFFPHIISIANAPCAELPNDFVFYSESTVHKACAVTYFIELTISARPVLAFSFCKPASS